MKTLRESINDLIKSLQTTPQSLGSDSQNRWYLESLLRILVKDGLADQAVDEAAIPIPYLEYSAQYGSRYKDLNQIDRIESEFQQSATYQQFKAAIEALKQAESSLPTPSPDENLSRENYYFLLKAARYAALVTVGALVVSICLASFAIGAGAVVFGAIAGVAAISCFGLFKTAQISRPDSEAPQSLIPGCCLA